MKLKYYLRGLGIGIIVTTIILVSCFSMQKPKMTDEQIIEKCGNCRNRNHGTGRDGAKKRTADSC